MSASLQTEQPIPLLIDLRHLLAQKCTRAACYILQLFRRQRHAPTERPLQTPLHRGPLRQCPLVERGEGMQWQNQMDRNSAVSQLRLWHVKSDLLEEVPCITVTCGVRQWDEDHRQKNTRSRGELTVPRLRPLCLSDKLRDRIDRGRRLRLTTMGLEHDLRYY